MAEPFNITALAVGALGIAGTVTGWVVNRKPQQADYASKLLDATVPAYETLSKRLASVEAQNDECQRRSERLEHKCERMMAYLRSVGLEIPGDIEGE